MSLVVIFLVGAFVLGLLLGPLATAFLVKLLSKEGGRSLGDWAVGLGLKSVWRPALTFNAASELTLKQRTYDEDHDEQKISFGGAFSGVDRELFDPQDRLHDWFGTPFGFVDERFGVIFDPRDAAAGRELLSSQEAGNYEHRVEKGQKLVESVQAVFKMPGSRDGVNLKSIWALIGGSFDSQLVRKIHEYYRKGQAPKADTTALRQLLVPVGTFIAIVLLGMFAAGQSGGGGGAPTPSGNESTVNIGKSLLLLAMPMGAYKRRDKAIIGLGTLALLVLTALLYLGFPIWVPVMGIPLPLGVWVVVMMGIGVGVVPFVASLFGRSLGPFGLLLGKLYITIGLLAYDRPVITLVSPNSYALREYEEHEWENEPKFYRFAMTRVGVGYDNDVDVWGEEVTESPARVDSMAASSKDHGIAADGGSPNVPAPSGFVATEMIKHDSIYGHVPEDVDDDATYVRTDLTTGRFFEAGQDRRLMTAALETAKEQYGGGNKPVSDKWILSATLVAMVLGAVFDWLVFF